MSAEGLVAAGLTVRYGGHTAVNAVSFSAPVGRITGLIGPNGAGKTTTFNACSGLLRVTDGAIHFAGRDITRLAPERRAQLGIGRTFQRMELFETVTVRENVALGCEGRLAGSNPLSHLRAARHERARAAQAADEAMALCELERLADRPVAELSTGQRRLVELARAVAGGYRLLLLDEPSSGLDQGETARFGEMLRRLMQRSGGDGLGILLVEHDMTLVMALCDHIYVLDFGSLIFDGDPAAVRNSAVVRDAYLGNVA
jgi:ABC-type branched-subunit amino acid transport system ATPase component